jgi:ribosome-binding factor A
MGGAAMSRHGAPPSQRQLRVAEAMRHVLAECLMRGELHDPRLDSRSITIGEVRVSRDLRAATVYAAELGAPLSADAAAALARASAWLGGRLAREMHLKYAPRLTFVADETYDHAARMERLLDEARRSVPPSGGEDGAA